MPAPPPVSAPAEPDVFARACPSRAVLARLANKWSLLVIDALDDGPMRNGALLRRVQGISQKMLTETLRELEDLNLLVRRSRNSVPPHVEYELTPLGRSLRALVCQLDRWVEEHLSDVRTGGEASPGAPGSADA